MLYLLMSIQWSVNRLLVVSFPVRNKNAYLSSRILLSVSCNRTVVVFPGDSDENHSDGESLAFSDTVTVGNAHLSAFPPLKE